ncbi:MAG: VOC family protein [Acidimicrobiales bacterium]
MAPKIHHITLTVSNVEQSSRWYQELLGDALVVEGEGPGWKRRLMMWPSGLVIGVTEYDAAPATSSFSHTNLGLDHVSLACASEAEVGQWFEKLETLGFSHGPLEDAPYGSTVTARDPDNIPLEFFCSKSSARVN